MAITLSLTQIFNRAFNAVTNRLKVEMSAAPLPPDAATETTQAAILAAIDGLEGFTDGLETVLASISGSVDGLEGFTDGLEGLLTALNGFVDGLEGFTDELETRVGALTETAPATDTASSGLNGRLQRIAQHLSTLIAFYSANFGSAATAIRTAAQIGNATGAADFNAGNAGAQTQRTVIATDQLPVAGKHVSEVDADNSTTDNLAADDNFTGEWVDALEFPMISVTVNASHASATDGLKIEYSEDATVVDSDDVFTIAAGAKKQFSFGILTRYYRINYTNGGTLTTTLRIQTLKHRSGRKPSTHRVIDSIVDDDDAELVKSVITAQDENGVYQNVKINSARELIVGVPSNATTSFGNITTSATTRVAVRKTAYTEPAANAQRSISSSSAADTAAGTGARTVKLTYLDTTGAGPFYETITLNGTTPVNTVATDIRFIEKLEVVTAGSGLVNAGTITLFGATGGGGGTVGTITAGDNQTFWAHHYVATGNTAVFTAISCGNTSDGVGKGVSIFLSKRALVANSVEIQISDTITVEGPNINRVLPSTIPVSGPAITILYATPLTSSSYNQRAAMDYFTR